MSVLGIISEYNPYHRGHAHLLDEAREKTGAAQSVSIMSGCFSQQGQPMICDKYLRASAAAASGIDLVFELPVLFATGSARDFAEGAVALLSALPFMEHLCFGVETPDISLFREIADCCVEEPELYRTVLQEEQKKGQSFPSAREEALAAVLGERVREAVRKPNNILALEYMTAIKRLHSTLKPCLIRRTADYHSGSADSATTIRNHLAGLVTGEAGSWIDPYLKDVLPSPSYERYRSASGGFLLSPEGLMPYLAARLMDLPEDLSGGELPLDMTAEIYHRLRKLTLPMDYTDMIDRLKRKNETRGRITRCLLHLILGICEKDRIALNKTATESLYLNLLSAAETGTSLLRDTGSLSVITKKSAFRPEDSVTTRLWELDCRAAFLYNQLYYDAFRVQLPAEMRRTPVIL